MYQIPRCQYVKKNGQNCKRAIDDQSRYCSQHIESKNNDNLAYTNVTEHLKGISNPIKVGDYFIEKWLKSDYQLNKPHIVTAVLNQKKVYVQTIHENENWPCDLYEITKRKDGNWKKIRTNGPQYFIHIGKHQQWKEKPELANENKM